MKKEIDFSATVDLATEDYQWSRSSTTFNDERIDGELISREAIQKRVRALARQISADHRDCDELLVIPVLKGAFVFASDLIREIHRSGGPGIAVDFIKTSTYGDELKTSSGGERKVRIELAPENVEGRRVLVVEDIIDQCLTMPVILDLLRERKAKSVKACVLIEKKLSNPTRGAEAFKKNENCNYTGFRIPDQWIAGYGIDAGQNFRELPFIVVVNEAYYR
ncbi:MAG: hypoxanthine phosphoribosyltransferase [Desulfobacterales bacterium]|nr:hypoxanthine phosphoribosyltransferase [Desulfobacterales bacterium]